MLHQALREVSIFRSLFKKDQMWALMVRLQGCPFCGGPLHCAFYERRPRGGPVDIPPQFCVRMSLCCGRAGCRRRVLPPSCLFMGRKVHWRVVILVLATIRQRHPKTTVERLEELCDVAVRTQIRWTAFFRDEFPNSMIWQRIRGRVSAVVSNGALPGALVEHFLDQHTDTTQALVACLFFLASGEFDQVAERIF